MSKSNRVLHCCGCNGQYAAVWIELGTIFESSPCLQVFDPEQFGALAQLLAKQYFVTGLCE